LTRLSSFICPPTLTLRGEATHVADEALIAILKSRWQRALEDTRAPDSAKEAVCRDLLERYSEPHRHYHTLKHLHQVLDVLIANNSGASLQLAAWFHDAIYDPRASDNEERSAALANDALAALLVPSRMRRQIEEWILATKTHTVSTDDLEGQLLLDADLSILGAAPGEYGAYADAIRREYAFVGDSEFRTGRSAVLAKFLKRHRIYLTPMIYAELETRARTNLNGEIQALQRVQS